MGTGAHDDSGAGAYDKSTVRDCRAVDLLTNGVGPLQTIHLLRAINANYVSFWVVSL
jgi:hypothetical protein